MPVTYLPGTQVLRYFKVTCTQVLWCTIQCRVEHKGGSGWGVSVSIYMQLAGQSRPIWPARLSTPTSSSPHCLDNSYSFFLQKTPDIEQYGVLENFNWKVCVYSHITSFPSGPRSQRHCYTLQRCHQLCSVSRWSITPMQAKTQARVMHLKGQIIWICFSWYDSSCVANRTVPD